jgi:hypothetical protein
LILFIDDWNHSIIESMDALEWRDSYYSSFEPLRAPLPDDVHILNVLARDSKSLFVTFWYHFLHPPFCDTMV